MTAWTLDDEFLRELRLIAADYRANGRLPVRASQGSRAQTETPIYFTNVSGEDIPAFACMQITDAVEEGGQNYLEADKPADTIGIAGRYLFNGPYEIADGANGIAQKGPVVRAYKSSGTIAAGGMWGPTSGQWYLTLGSGPYIAAGEDDIDSNVFRVIVDSEKALVCKTSGSGIAARSGTTVSSGTCTIWSRSGTTLSATSNTVTVYNLSTTAVGNSVYIVAQMTNIGWVAVWEDC